MKVKITVKGEIKMIKGTEYLRRGEKLLAAVRVETRSKAVAHLGHETYRELRNDIEPYDSRTHIFELPANELEKSGGFDIELHFWESSNGFFLGDPSFRTELHHIEYNESLIVDAITAVTRSRRGMVRTETEQSGELSGCEYRVELYKTPDGNPVRVYTLTADPALCRFIAGTPEGRGVADGSTQTVIGEAEAMVARGERVIAAFNADFYDMFASCRPSGLCVTNGSVVDRAESRRPFLGLTKSGEFVISTLEETPLDSLAEAVSGMQLIVRNGKIHDTAPLEPFGDVAHPRTAVGIRNDGKIIFMVVDGRRPDWSNGASLTELSDLMLERGAIKAINLDGGGSSTFIVRKEDELTMLNHPADLHRPLEDLIRPVFNSIIIVSR